MQLLEPYEYDKKPLILGKNKTHIHGTDVHYN